MVSSSSQVYQFGNLQNCYDKSASTVCCTICGDLLPSVLSYHNHNVNKHTCDELSLAIIKLFGLKLGQKCELKEQITESIFECDSLYYNKKSNLAVQKDISKKEICQGTELQDENLIYIGSFMDTDESAEKSGWYAIKDCVSETGKYNINKKENDESVEKCGQYAIKDCVSETGKYNINKKENSLLRIKKSTNVGNDLYENKKVPSKEIKLEEDMLIGNKGLNICDYLVAEEVFLQPKDYTEETVSVESGTKAAAVTEADDSLDSLILDENYIQGNSNNTFSEYNHPQMMHQSDNESENDDDFIAISGSEMEENDDISLLAHSPKSDFFSTTDSISLASLIFLILQNSVEGLPASVIDMLLQGLFPYFFKNLSYSYVKCDMLDLIQKTLRKERGFRKTRVKGMAYNELMWETTSSISKYVKEIQNLSNLDDFTKSPALVKALKNREVKININAHGFPVISYSQHQQCSLQEGSVRENVYFKQGNNVHSKRNMRCLRNQDSFNIKSHSRSNKQENMLVNNNNQLLSDFNHVHQDLKGMLQNEFANNSTENTQTADVSTPKRKKIKNEKETQHDFQVKENFILHLENSNEWAEIENIHVKSEPLLWDPRDQESDQNGQALDQKGQEGDNWHNNYSYEDVDINNYIYNGERIYDIDTETLNISSESNQSTFENERNIVLGNNKKLEGSEKRLLPQTIYEENCSSVCLEQRIPCNVLHEQNNVSIEEKILQEETSQCKTGVYLQEQEPAQGSKRPRIPIKEKDMNKLKKSLNKETDNRNPTKKKQLRRKQSSSKSDGLIRNLTTHRISEKMRRKELNEQFDHLTKRLPKCSHGKSLPKISVLNKSRKYISKLKNTNIQLLIEKESLEEYQQTLINTLNKPK